VPSHIGALASSLVDHTSVHHLEYGALRAPAPTPVHRLTQYVRVHASLSGADLGPEVAGDLARALSANTSVHTLNLHANRLGDDGLALLLGGLQDNHTLTTLL
jgi:hypothetical protein